MDIRINLRNVIKDKAYNQAAVAKKAGMTPDKLSQVVNLNRKLDANEMFALCEVIEMTPSELAGYGLTQDGNDRIAAASRMPDEAAT